MSTQAASDIEKKQRWPNLICILNSPIWKSSSNNALVSLVWLSLDLIETFITIFRGLKLRTDLQWTGNAWVQWFSCCSCFKAWFNLQSVKILQALLTPLKVGRFFKSILNTERIWLETEVKAIYLQQFQGRELATYMFVFWVTSKTRRFLPFGVSAALIFKVIGVVWVTIKIPKPSQVYYLSYIRNICN